MREGNIPVRHDSHFLKHPREGLHVKRARYLSTPPHFVHTTKNTLPLLRQLRGEGFALALISNLASAYVPVLRRLGVHQLVDEATYSCEVGVVKPDPAIYGLTLEKLGVAPQNATMVGNSIRADVLGAKAAGLRAVWITENDDPAHVCLRGLADLRSVLP